MELGQTYEVLPHAAAHTCWDDPDWSGKLTDGCHACDQAKALPCRYCGFGHVFCSHNAEQHAALGDPQVTIAFSPSWAWADSPHIYINNTQTGDK